MKKQILTSLLFSAILIQCQEEVQVSQDFPIVITVSAKQDERGITFEGKLIDNGGHEILSHGFVYSRFIDYYDLGREVGVIVYELGDPGDETFSLNKKSIGIASIYGYRAFVTYMDNSTKKTVYGNVLLIDSKVAGGKLVWNLIAANETFIGNGEGLAVVTYYRRGNIPEAYIIQQDGKVTKFDIDARVTSGALDFPVNANQENVKFYGVTPFVLNSQNKNVYSMQENSSWAVSTQLPFDPEKLAKGDVYMNFYYPYVHIFGSFGTHLYNFRDNIWETRTTLPLSSGQAIVTGTNIYDQHYILTTDGSIRQFNESSPPILFATLPDPIEGQAHMFFVNEMLYVSLNNLSGQKMWQFNPLLAKWSEAEPFPEALNYPLYFNFGNKLYIANKKANGNYDIWNFSQFE